MKRALMIVGILLISVSLAVAQSTVKGVIVNKSDVKNAANIAAGPGATANMGSIQIKESQVKGVIVNKSDVKNAANIAAGPGTEANMGSVVVK